MGENNRLTLDVGGVVMEIEVPSGWLPPLAARYGAFISAAQPVWHTRLIYDPSVVPDATAWIEHDELFSRFQVYGYAGWLDLAAHSAAISTPSPERAVSALERLLVYVCMQALPREHEGLLLHACGVLRNGAGEVFVGPSGAGKTTIARLATGHGQVVGDENVIVRLDGDVPKLISTPFWGSSTPPEIVARVRVEAPLRAVYVLTHAPGFACTRLSAAEAALALLASEKVAVERPASAAAWLAVAERLTAQVGMYRLAFRPAPELWAFLTDEIVRKVSVAPY